MNNINRLIVATLAAVMSFAAVGCHKFNREEGALINAYEIERSPAAAAIFSKYNIPIAAMRKSTCKNIDGPGTREVSFAFAGNAGKDQGYAGFPPEVAVRFGANGKPYHATLTFPLRKTEISDGGKEHKSFCNIVYSSQARTADNYDSDITIDPADSLYDRLIHGQEWQDALTLNGLLDALATGKKADAHHLIMGKAAAEKLLRASLNVEWGKPGADGYYRPTVVIAYSPYGNDLGSADLVVTGKGWVMRENVPMGARSYSLEAMKPQPLTLRWIEGPAPNLRCDVKSLDVSKTIEPPTT
jgi:hypothetical protein